MKVETRLVDGIRIMNLIGKLDSSTTPMAHERMMYIADIPATQVVLNLDQLEYVSSAGLSSILMMGRRLKQSGGKFNICQAREVVKEVLETSGVGEIVDVFESLDEARGALVE